MKTKPVCETVLPWLKANLGNHCLGCLTGYSGRALAAAVQIISAYASCDGRAVPHLMAAFREIVITLDDPERELVYHSIAHVLDWGDRAATWQKANCPPLAQAPARCKFE